MNEQTSHTPYFIAALPAPVLVVLTMLAVALWVFLHRRQVRPPAKAVHPGLVFLRWALGAVALWLSCHTISLVVALATNWSWFLLAAAGSTAVEAVVFLYRLEQQAIRENLGRIIKRLRLAAVLLVMLILAEPVLERFVIRTLEHYVVVLLDQSESMLLSDPQRDVQELFDLAVFYGVIDPGDYEQLDDGTPDLPETVEVWLEQLDAETRAELERLLEKNRLEIAERILRGEHGDDGLIAGLQRRYQIRVVGFAASPKVFETMDDWEEQEQDEEKRERADWQLLTNLTAALEYPLDNIPPEQTAGVVMLGDFRDTARSHPEAAAIRLGQRGAPVYPIVIGSARPRRDLAVTNVEAPDSIYKGERLRAEASLKLFGVPGEDVQVVFMRGDTVVEEQTVSVPADQETFRTMVEFVDEPEEDGILSYSIQVQEMADEVVHDNNRWDFQTAVSEDRTNVLLVDSRPRWEFRYLRNLFYRRDKSVHLQYVITNPDSIAAPGEEEPPPRLRVVASASRPFGEAEATLLPISLEEWRKFDVIIIGDVPPGILTESQLEHIETCVNERGTALIVIAGPSYMPHKFDNPVLERLLPIVYNPTPRSYFSAPEPVFRFQPTMEGRRHPIMQLAPSVSESERAWTNLPNLQWRYQVEDIKPGATVLAYAVIPEDEQDILVAADVSPEETSRRIRELAEIQQRNSLMVAHQFGLGRVLMLNFDRTWRLRFRVGDTLHHRFWGRVMTWGAGENLRAGSAFVRLGTDSLTYSPEETVKVTARVLRPDYTPVTDDRVSIEVYRDQTRVTVHNLSYRPQSQGMYDAEIGPFREPGTYRITLSGNMVNRILEWEEAPEVETEFRVATVFNPVELAEFSTDPETAQRIADVSAGELLNLRSVEEITEAFGPGAKGEPERVDVTLWDHWLLLLILLGLFTAEWLLRRKGGLP